MIARAGGKTHIRNEYNKYMMRVMCRRIRKLKLKSRKRKGMK